MTVAIALFALAAAGGLTLAYLRINNRTLPMPLALVHGAAAAAGLIALLLVVFGGTAVPGQARLALGLFVLAALGGFALFSFHVRGKQLPIALVAIHGLAAVVAFLLLILAVSAGG